MCTDFSIKAENGDIIIGRSMELGIELGSLRISPPASACG